MLLTKRCPKCGGNLLIGSDYYGRYATCMQCGRAVDLPRENGDEVDNLEQRDLVGSGRGRGRARL